MVHQDLRAQHEGYQAPLDGLEATEKGAAMLKLWLASCTDPAGSSFASK
jgi:hypothetical protein